MPDVSDGSDVAVLTQPTLRLRVSTNRRPKGAFRGGDHMYFKDGAVVFESTLFGLDPDLTELDLDEVELAGDVLEWLAAQAHADDTTSAMLAGMHLIPLPASRTSAFSPTL